MALKFPRRRNLKPEAPKSQPTITANKYFKENFIEKMQSYQINEVP